MVNIDNKVDVNWIRRKMAEVGIPSDAELGRRSGIANRALITYILQGKRNIQGENLVKMAEALNVAPRELAKKLGGRPYEFIQALEKMEKKFNLPIKGNIDDRFSVVFYPETYDYQHVKLDIKPGFGAYALEYKTEHTPFAMFDSCIAIVLEKRDIDPPSMLLRNNVVWLSDGRVLIRRVREGQLPGHFTLDGTNVPPIYDAKLLAFSPVQALLIAK